MNPRFVASASIGKRKSPQKSQTDNFLPLFCCPASQPQFRTSCHLQSPVQTPPVEVVAPSCPSFPGSGFTQGSPHPWTTISRVPNPKYPAWQQGESNSYTLCFGVRNTGVKDMESGGKQQLNLVGNTNGIRWEIPFQRRQCTEN